MFALVAASLMLVAPGFMLPVVIILCNRRTRKMDMADVASHSQRNRAQKTLRRRSQTSSGEASQKHEVGNNNPKGLVSDFTQTSIGRIPISTKREESTQSSGRNVPKSKEHRSKVAKKHSLRGAEPPGTNDQHKLEAERRERRKQQALKQRESRQNYYRQIHNRPSENTLFEVRNEEMPETDLVPQYYAKKIMQQTSNCTQESRTELPEEPTMDETLVGKESEYLSWDLKCATPVTARLPTWVVNRKLKKSEAVK